MRVKDALAGLTAKKIDWDSKVVERAVVQRWVVEYDGIPYYCLCYKFGVNRERTAKVHYMELHDLEANSISVALLNNIKIYEGKCFNELSGKIEDL